MALKPQTSLVSTLNAHPESLRLRWAQQPGCCPRNILMEPIFDKGLAALPMATFPNRGEDILPFGVCVTSVYGCVRQCWGDQRVDAGETQQERNAQACKLTVTDDKQLAISTVAEERGNGQ